jgi:anti-sigma regulatory factor (Ser/Thr protein kinase)
MTQISQKADTRALREHVLSLHDATMKISAGVGLEGTVRGLGQAVVPFLADVAAIHLLDRLLAEDPAGLDDPPAHGNPQAVGALRLLALIGGEEGGQRAGRMSASDVHFIGCDHPGWQAMASRQPVLLRRVGPELVKELVGSDGIGSRGEMLCDGSLLALPLSAGGQILGCAILLRDSARAPFDDVDVLTASLLAAQASQGIDSTCKYQSEATIASTLQRSMLPTQPPRIGGVEIAHRYLPGSKDAQVGGDWFDAIALPGSRVALVVGDVMGHGIRSAAIMGHLRTSVQTLAALDLPPEQVLRHLDDIARRLDDDHLATCVYAVYDPVARSCVIANAGHIPPVLVHQGGQAELLSRLPAGAPIGVGGVPFEPMEVKTSDGDLLVLCTDGLVEMRGRDIGSGLAALCDLAAPDATPDELCEILMRTLHTQDREDDVALLIARLRGIPSTDIAQWLLHPQPSTPSLVRRLVRRTLAEWGLYACGEVTELLASELATNAVRYASRPIELRLMRTEVLLCEVKDDDHHLPVLRSATENDEVGRGLHLVSSLARSWGANRTNDGKVVWFDLALPLT